MSSTTILGAGLAPGDFFVLWDENIDTQDTEVSVFLHELGHNILGYIDVHHQSTSGDDSSPEKHCRNDCLMYYQNYDRDYYCADCWLQIHRDGIT